MSTLAEHLSAGWPLVATLATALAAARLRDGRRRSALNRALHELRRPLHALALAASPTPASAGPAPAPLDLAIAALDDLDREINGGPAVRLGWRLVAARELAGTAVGRWRSRAAMTGGSIQLRWKAGKAVVLADPPRLAQALDNLILNALEHGGPEIRVEGRCAGDRLHLAVSDDGATARSAERRESPAAVLARLTGRSRHGHGLQVVRHTAASHGGRFVIRHSERGTSAVLELPLAAGAGARAA